MHSISFLSFFFGGSYGVLMFCTIMCVLFVFIIWVARISGASPPWVLPVTPVSYMLS